MGDGMRCSEFSVFPEAYRLSLDLGFPDNRRKGCANPWLSGEGGGWRLSRARGYLGE